MTAPASTLLLDIPQLAELLGMTPKSIRCRLDQNLIPYRRLGGKIVFIRAEIEVYFSSLPGVTLEQARENLKQRKAGA